MSHWPQPSQFVSHQATISSWSSLGMLNGIGSGNVPFSGTLGTAPKLYAFPFRLARPMLAQRAFWLNGATVAGNITVGVYGCTPGGHSDGAEIKLAETSSTAQSGINAIQSVAIGLIYLMPGLYYGAFLFDNSTMTMFRSSSNLTVSEGRHVGNYQRTLGSYALPATLGTPRVAEFAMPVFGLATQTVI